MTGHFLQATLILLLLASIAEAYLARPSTKATRALFAAIRAFWVLLIVYLGGFFG